MADPKSGPNAVRDAGTLRAIYEARSRAELDAADAFAPGSSVVEWRGCLTPTVAVIKGLAGPAEASGGAAVSGADGEAVSKALASLGHDPGQVFFTLSRPEPSIDAQARARRLRVQVEAVDAPLVIALDVEAAEDLARAFEIPALKAGVLVRVAGRRLLACEGLESSLTDGRAKRRVWRQLKAAVVEPPVY